MNNDEIMIMKEIDIDHPRNSGQGLFFLHAICFDEQQINDLKRKLHKRLI